MCWRYGEGELGQGVLVKAVEGGGQLERLLAALTQEVYSTLYVRHGYSHSLLINSANINDDLESQVRAEVLLLRACLFVLITNKLQCSSLEITYLHRYLRSQVNKLHQLCFTSKTPLSGPQSPISYLLSLYEHQVEVLKCKF